MKTNSVKMIIISSLLASGLALPPLFANIKNVSVNSKIKAVITFQIFKMARENESWKLALMTGKDAQVVFMSITPKTNPNNEIGMETHPFDQVIFVAEGHAQSDLNGKKSEVRAGDMIFIPQGIPHNFINLSKKKPFKIISVYSATDIPAHTFYQQKSDMSQE